MIAKPKAPAPGADLVDDPDHLVTRDDPRTPGRQVPFGQMQVGTADTARQDPQPQLAGRRRRIG
jgi:hypothetical protein